MLFETKKDFLNKHPMSLHGGPNKSCTMSQVVKNYWVIKEFVSSMLPWAIASKLKLEATWINGKFKISRIDARSSLLLHTPFLMNELWKRPRDPNSLN